MVLAAQGELDIDRPVADLLPAPFSSAAPRFTSRMLMTHTAGLAAWRPYFQMLSQISPEERKTAVRQILLREPETYRPGTETVYSDVGFMFLDWLLEEIAGRPVSAVLPDIYSRLGVSGLFFPTRQGVRGHYAAGQLCPWRCRLLKGEVDDENAHSLGGVSGHAGLFGTAAGVHRALSSLWRCHAGRYEGAPFTATTVRTFLTPPADSGRALGFDVPAGGAAACGNGFKGPVIGHLGFTGVSFWLELATGVHVVMLTNRTHPYRFARGIRDARPAIHDVVMAAVADVPSPP
jgi:CubicO group peptidase (beta-lactamase class C family)